MNKSWPRLPLGEVLAYRKEFTVIDDLNTYKRCRVQLHSQGIVLRDSVAGAEIKTKKQQVCRAGEFLVAETDAKVGGFGIVPDELDGAIVSSHYFLYVINDKLLDRRFLHFYIRTPGFRDQVAAQGSTNYAAIRPQEVLHYEMPLPPMPEQRRLVARIEALAGKIEEAKGLRRSTIDETKSVIDAERAGIFATAAKNGTVRLDEAATLARGKFTHRPRNEPRFFGGDYPWIQIGEIELSNKYIRQWSQTLNDDGLAISRKFTKGTLLISIAATIGAVGILDFDCCVPDSIVAVIPMKGYQSEFLYHYLGYLRSHLEHVAPQSAQKNINLQILATLPVPKLTENEQLVITAHVDTLQSKVDSLEVLQSETAAELAALLPAILDRAFKGEL
jgi:type I restriction enzyme S subunit